MLSSIFATFLLIFAAEFGDKSQLVCMLLASKHRGLPVLLGAITAFAILNLLAVTLGAAISLVIPQLWLTAFVVVLFTVFGVKSLCEKVEDETEEIHEKPGHTVFITAFLMIFVAELGDKTQLTIAALGASSPPLPIYIGATCALALTSLLGVAAGRWITQHISIRALHRVSGVMFLAFAGWTATGLF